MITRSAAAAVARRVPLLLAAVPAFAVAALFVHRFLPYARVLAAVSGIAMLTVNWPAILTISREVRRAGKPASAVVTMAAILPCLIWLRWPPHDLPGAGALLPMAGGLALLAGTAALPCAWLMLALAHAGPGAVRRVVHANLAGIAWLGGGLLLIAWQSRCGESFVYFWDFRNYWDKAESLHAMLAAGAWHDAIVRFGDLYTADYSLVPAVLPAVAALPLPGLGSQSFCLLITLLYALPAYAAVGVLAMRLLDPGFDFGSHGSGRLLATSAAIALLAFPDFLGTTLYLMPDIGGVALMIGALLCVDRLLDVTGALGAPRDPVARAGMVVPALGMALCLCMMFVFRRWYAFAAVGICGAGAVMLAASWLAGRAAASVLWQSLWKVAVLAATTACCYLSWFAFDWIGSAAAHDYASLYASYRHPLAADLHSFLSRFGVLAPLLCLAGLASLLWADCNRRLLALVVLSTVIAVALFLRVQSPGRQHFMLLMPLLGAVTGQLGGRLLRRSRPVFLAGLVALIVLPALARTAHSPANANAPAGSLPLAPSLADWRPKTQPYLEGYLAIGRWLTEPANVHARYCVLASGTAINQGIFDQLWQILPESSKPELDHRLIYLGEVDSRDGPPTRYFRLCELALVAVPFQFHLAPSEQEGMKILMEDMVGGVGTGRAFRRDPMEFRMDPGVVVQVYRRTRELDDSELEDVANRYRSFKSSRPRLP